MRAYPSAAYDALSSLQHPTQSILGRPTIASSMGKAKSPATPNTLDMPRSLSLERTCSMTDFGSIFGARIDPCGIFFPLFLSMTRNLSLVRRIHEVSHMRSTDL